MSRIFRIVALNFQGKNLESVRRSASDLRGAADAGVQVNDDHPGDHEDDPADVQEFLLLSPTTQARWGQPKIADRLLSSHLGPNIFTKTRKENPVPIIQIFEDNTKN